MPSRYAAMSISGPVLSVVRAGLVDQALLFCDLNLGRCHLLWRGIAVLLVVRVDGADAVEAPEFPGQSLAQGALDDAGDGGVLLLGGAADVLGQGLATVTLSTAFFSAML
jgi:hypothetical protein